MLPLQEVGGARFRDTDLSLDPWSNWSPGSITESLAGFDAFLTRFHFSHSFLHIFIRKLYLPPHYVYLATRPCNFYCKKVGQRDRKEQMKYSSFVNVIDATWPHEIWCDAFLTRSMRTPKWLSDISASQGRFEISTGCCPLSNCSSVTFTCSRANKQTHASEA